MPTRADLRQSIAEGTRSVNAVLRGFWGDVRRILERWGDRPLDRFTRPTLLWRIDTLIGRVFGLTRQAAQVSTLFQAIVGSTDAATARTMARHVDRVRRIAGPDLWRQVTSGTVGEDRFRQIVDAVEGRLPAQAAQEVYRASALNPERAWVEGSRKTLSDRVSRVGRRVKRAVTDAVNKAKRAVDVLPGIRNPDSRTMPGDAAARTIVQTETARVANEAERVMTRVVPSTGLRYRLSAGHHGADLCDPYANEDRHGLGVGVYPPGECPMPPRHPNCECYVETVPLDPEKTRAWLERRYGMEAAA
jgi:hypothetical protein